jgi:hypothetical protein
MKAQELRIGNYISIANDDSEVLRVQAIKLYDSDSDESCIRLESLESWIEISCVAPILLTKEWLLDFGFNHWGLKINDELQFLLTTDGSIALARCGRQLEVNAVYVHELQNLYYALTKQELTL